MNSIEPEKKTAFVIGEYAASDLRNIRMDLTDIGYSGMQIKTFATEVQARAADAAPTLVISRDPLDWSGVKVCSPQSLARDARGSARTV